MLASDADARDHALLPRQCMDDRSQFDGFRTGPEYRKNSHLPTTVKFL